MATIHTVTGTVMGKSKFYLKLDADSARVLGRRTLDQKKVHWDLNQAGLVKGDKAAFQVSVNPTTGRQRVVALVLMADIPAAEATDEYIPPFETPNGLFPCVPDRDSKYLIPGQVAMILDSLAQLVQVDDRVNVRLTGPQGTGKTSLGKALAANLGWNFVKIDCGGIREPADWFCNIVAVDGDKGTVTKANPSLFLHAITTPKTVVLLDEFNRVDSTIHNAVYGLLDEHGFAWSDDLRTRIDRAPQVIVLSTMNIEETNVGTFELDSAIRDRFPIEIRLELLPEAALAKVVQGRTNCEDYIAQKLARLAHEIEKLVGSTLLHGSGTRPLIAAAKLMNCGIDWVTACSATVVAGFDHMGGADSERSIVTNLVMGLR